MTHDQVSGLLSGLVGISVLVAGFFQWLSVAYGGPVRVKTWAKGLFACLFAVQAVAIVLPFA